jgi:hypothetical protein
MKVKKKVLAYVLFAVGLSFLIVSALSPEVKPSTDNHQQTASTAGNNSPAMNASTIGSNSSVIQVNTMNYSVGATIEQIKQAMREVQKEKDPDLRKTFQLGYFLFAATERQEIVPLGSPMDDILQVDWKAGYTVSFSTDTVSLHISRMHIHFPDGPKTEMSDLNVTIPRRIEPPRAGIYGTRKFQVACAVVSTSTESVVIAMGVRFSPVASSR